MLILGLEFSSPTRTVALVESDGEESRLVGTASDHGSRDVRPLPLIEKLLTQAKVPTASVDAIAVGFGPGSYTGIRSAIAISEGWKLARGIKLAGISSAECLAVQATENGWFGDVHVVIDAQRGEVYVARYKISLEGRELVEPLRLAKPAELDKAGSAESRLIGPEVTQWFANGQTLLPEAQVVARLAAQELRADAPETRLEPIYLRETSFVKAPKPKKLPL